MSINIDFFLKRPCILESGLYENSAGAINNTCVPSNVMSQEETGDVSSRGARS